MDPKPRKLFDRHYNTLKSLWTSTIIHQPIAPQQNRVLESCIEFEFEQLD